MCKRGVYLFLVFGLCLSGARADLTMAPLSSWDITGDYGDVLSLNGYPVSRLIVGTTVFANPPGNTPEELAQNADDFSLATAASADSMAWVETVFTQPVRIIFMLEKNGNDSGTIQGLDVNRNLVGGIVTFTGGALYWTNTGYLSSLLAVNHQNAWGTVITSDIPIYGIRITAPGIDPVSIMAVGQPVGLSSSPSPADGATDVLRDAVPSWTPGKFAATHDVYFGTVFADVNTASRTSPKGVLVSQGQDANAYDPAALLAFGQTYYWRVDEVNAPPDSTIYRGEVWSFTAEPVAYAIRPVMATASSSYTPDNAPGKTIDGSGLNASDQHSTDDNAIWLSDVTGPQPTWIRYDFDKVYKLYEMWVWNANTAVESTFGLGAKDVTI